MSRRSRKPEPVARAMILELIAALDYDLWKEYSDPENSEDPDLINDQLRAMEEIVDRYWES